LWQLWISGNSDYASLILISLVVLMIVVMHRSNLQRLISGNEHRIKFTKKGN